MKRIIFLCSLVLGIWIYNAQAEDKVVAVVNGVSLKESQLQRIMDELLPRAFYHQTVTAEKRAELRKKAIEELVRRELYYQEAKKKGIRVEKSDINQGLETIKKRFNSKKEYKEALKQAGISEDELKKDIERNLIIQKFYDKEVIEKSKVSEEFLKDYYERNKKDFLRPESVRIRHILIRVEPGASSDEKKEKKKEAEDILKRARAGEDFGELAYNYSADDWRVKGGDLGLVHRGRLLPELEEVAFKLKPGEISDLIETIYGFHIIKMEEKVPPTQLSFDEIKDKLKREIEEKRRKELEEALIKRLKETAKIEVMVN
ncbi:MAG: peptidylprolyl isomerase [Thermodesulfovibrionales bacterium]|nr:peptidylprolyl isomerase [Thermodesulfovibrionales bacterium]